MAFANASCRFSGSMLDAGSIVTRSFAPFPLRTRIWR